MNKPLTAKKLYKYLKNLKREGNDLSKVIVNYRFDYDSDVAPCVDVAEDLYDAKTNQELISIVLVTDNKDV